MDAREASPDWILRKAAIAIAVCGGLGLGELKRFKLSQLRMESAGIRIRCPKDTEGDDKNFLVPFSKSEPCLASAVITYLDLLRRCLPDVGMDAALFHRVVKNGYIETPIGRNRFNKIGQQVASRLGLESPELYYSNCFKLIEDDTGTPLEGRKRTISDTENAWGKIFKGSNSADKKRPRFSTSSASSSQ